MIDLLGLFKDKQDNLLKQLQNGKLSPFGFLNEGEYLSLVYPVPGVKGGRGTLLVGRGEVGISDGYNCISIREGEGINLRSGSVRINGETIESAIDKRVEQKLSEIKAALQKGESK